MEKQNTKPSEGETPVISLQDYRIERKLLRRGMVIKKDPKHNIRMVLRLRRKDSAGS